MARKKHERDENAVVRIMSIQNAEGETDQSELNTTASYRITPEAAEIIYTELDETGDVSGETIITVLQDGLVTIRKTSFADALMILERGKTHPVKYSTLLGTRAMLVCALEINAELDEEGGSLHLRYLIDIGEAYSAQNTIDLRVSLRSS